MKKLLLLCGIIAVTLSVKAQPVEENKKLLHAFTSFSAATLYNTYGIIGSIGDGFGADVYDAETTKNLLNAQKDLMDNLVKVLEDLKSSGALTDSVNINYATSSITIMKNLKEQARLMVEYALTKKRKILDAYEKLRTDSWKDISRLMGIKE